jgi:hypothetical protein
MRSSTEATRKNKGVELSAVIASEAKQSMPELQIGLTGDRGGTGWLRFAQLMTGVGWLG